MAKNAHQPTQLALRISSARAQGKSFFEHQSRLNANGQELRLHPDLDPARRNKAGLVIRESRDSENYPESHAVAIVFDGTGSMRKNPVAFVERLPKIMPLLISGGWIKQPHLLFGVVGDATGDKVPLQMGQFEGDNTMDNVLSRMILEGNGQSNMRESYELAMFFLNTYADMDCFNKRGKKGYLFMIGDERPFNKVSREQVKALIGTDIPADIPTQSIINELERKFNVYWIMPAGTRYYDNDEICDALKELFGQRFIKLENPDLIAETIVGLIAKNEGAEASDVRKALTDISGEGAAKVVAKAIGGDRKAIGDGEDKDKSSKGAFWSKSGPPKLAKPPLAGYLQG